MNLNERQSKIMGLARTEGRVMVDNLASRFEVTTQTVRRDLNELAQNGLLSRVHGGAMLATSVNNIDYQERRALSLEAKRVIGAHAAAMIPDGCSLFLNIGTTTEQVAHALRERSDLIVVTNNINAVNILSALRESRSSSLAAWCANRMARSSGTRRWSSFESSKSILR